MHTHIEPQVAVQTPPPVNVFSYTLDDGRIINANSTHAPLWAIVEGDNPRTYFDDKEMEELEASVQAQGVIQPIIVRVNSKGLLEKVVGGRRYRAANKMLGEDYEIPISFRVLTDEEAAALALIENHHRSNVTPTEEAVYAMKLLSSFKGDRDETAKYLGWSRSVLDNRLALTALSESAMKALNERKIVLGIAELLANISKKIKISFCHLFWTRTCRLHRLKTGYRSKVKTWRVQSLIDQSVPRVRITVTFNGACLRRHSTQDLVVKVHAMTPKLKLN